VGAVICPCDHEVCIDKVCRAWGCRISGATPLEACQDCGEPVVLVRRLIICDVCLATYGEGGSTAIATIAKG
jgi:predicted amidophosphoribosyltransferase